MELALIGIVALLTAGVTLFSGFGLGTILMPAFALFFPVPLAIAATAVVHLANNIFKFGLMAKQADWPVVARFGVPAAMAAIVGASLLTWFDRMPVVASYTIGGSVYEITVVKAVIGVLIVVFALLELWPRFQTLAFPPRWLALGGVLSGFFGGLSGNQGALRLPAESRPFEGSLCRHGCRLGGHRRCGPVDHLRNGRHGGASCEVAGTDCAGCRRHGLRVHRLVRG